jgi:hypothetical protein
MEICEGLSMPDSHIVARIKHIAANAADVCLYVEGINEPNYVRGGGAVPSDWRQRTVAKQRLIWQTVKGDSRLSRVKVLGPSLQAVKATEGDYNILGDLGLAQYIDYAAIHRYPGGHYPNVLLDTNVSWVKRHLSGRPVWITETATPTAWRTPRGTSQCLRTSPPCMPRLPCSKPSTAVARPHGTSCWTTSTLAART